MPIVLAQHVEDASSLWMLRAHMAGAPHVRLDDLGRFDERLAASLDGIAIAGIQGIRACERALDAPLPGDLFAAAVIAIRARDAALLDRLVAIAAAVPELARGLRSACGWVAPGGLSGRVVDWLGATDPRRIVLGLAACGMHRVDPGEVIATVLRHDDPAVRSRAVRLVGELGARVHHVAVARAIDDPDGDVATEAARTAVLLGDRGPCLDRLAMACVAPGGIWLRAWEVALRALDPRRANSVLRAVATDPSRIRELVIGAGMVGDARYLPWLVERMAEDAVARVAGEAFALVTGCDLEAEGLTREAPADLQAGPNDDPRDDAVAMDPDEHLPWPDAEKVARWLQVQGGRFAVPGRWFLGSPWSPEAADLGLREGCQRQRRAAAVLRTLCRAGVLFDVHAPVKRQRRLLAR